MAATSLSFESPGIGCKPAIRLLRKSPTYQWFEYQISLPEERFKTSIWFATSIDSSIEPLIDTDRQNLTAITLAPRIANPSSLFLFSILRQFVLEPFIDITAPELYKVFQYEMPSKTTKTNTRNTSCILAKNGARDTYFPRFFFTTWSRAHAFAVWIWLLHGVMCGTREDDHPLLYGI